MRCGSHPTEGYELLRIEACHVSRVTSDSRFLPFPFAARGHFVFARLPFAVALADLLFDLLGDAVNGCIQIALDVLGEQVGSTHRQSDGAAKLLSQSSGVIVFEGDARLDRALVEVIQFLQPAQDMIFNRLGQGQVMRRKN